MKRQSLLVLLFAMTTVFVACNSFKDDLYGKYKGTVVTGYGNKEASLELKKLPNKEISVYLLVKTPYCVGEFDGKGKLNNNVITAIDRDDDNICTVTLTINRKKVQTAEKKCMYWHGFQCSFEGNFSK